MINLSQRKTLTHIYGITTTHEITICKVLKEHQENLMIKKSRDLHPCPVFSFSVLKRNRQTVIELYFETHERIHPVATKHN